MQLQILHQPQAWNKQRNWIHRVFPVSRFTRAVKVTVSKCLFSINFPTRTITLMDLQCLWMIKHDYFQRSSGIVNSLLLCGNKWLIGVYLLHCILSYDMINQPFSWCFLSAVSDIISFPRAALHVSCPMCNVFHHRWDIKRNISQLILLALIWSTP